MSMVTKLNSDFYIGGFVCVICTFQGRMDVLLYSLYRADQAVLALLRRMGEDQTSSSPFD